MPETLGYRHPESSSTSNEGGQVFSRKAGADPWPAKIVHSTPEGHEARESQIGVHTQSDASLQLEEHQSKLVLGETLRDEQTDTTARQDPRGLALGIARRFEVTQRLSRDGIDSMYMEDVTRLAHDLFASFFPPELDDLQQPKIVPMTWQAVHFEHTFIAAAWLGSASRLLMTGSSLPLSQRELRIYHSAISHLQQALRDPVLQTHDSTIQAILHLTFQPPSPSSEILPRAPRQSIFHTWNVVNVTSGLRITEEHLRGVKAVVSAKGGIQNIKTHHIRHLVSFQDLNYATRHLLRPSFPYIARSSNIQDRRHLMGSPLERAGYLSSTADGLSTHNFGFSRISWPQFAEENRQPLQVWTYLADLVAILEQYVSGDPACNPQLLIVDQLCFVQHCLMSLPSAAELLDPFIIDGSKSTSSPSSLVKASTERQRKFYETARLGSIAFSHIVTHPTSATSFPRLRVTKELLRALRILQKEELSFGSLETTEAQLAFWASVVGAIVALGLPTRHPLANQVATWARHPMVRVENWFGAKKVVERFLWHSETSDVDALELWIEMGDMRS